MPGRAPGVGKTSLGQSSRAATGRKFVRMALGGVRDEAEIRGHRRTYIGSMPGKMLQSLKKVGTRNPLFLLDEIDKMGMDFRGDPASALLEVLDPEQNHTFGDHYVGRLRPVGRDVSSPPRTPMNIPPALLDRMEVIRLSGYTEDERSTSPRLPAAQADEEQRREGRGFEVTEGAIAHDPLLHARGRRAFARARDVKICRKVVRVAAAQAVGAPTRSSSTGTTSNDFLGVRKYSYGRAGKQNQVGQVVGLAWTGSAAIC